MFEDIVRAGTAPNQRPTHGVKSKLKTSLPRQGGVERPRPNTRTGDNTVADLNAAIKMDRVNYGGDNYDSGGIFPDEALAFDEVVDNWNSERTRLLNGAAKHVNNNQEARAKTATSGSRSRSGQSSTVTGSAGSIYTQSGPNVVLNNSSRNASANKHSLKLGTGLGQSSNNSASVYKSSAVSSHSGYSGQSGGLFRVKERNPSTDGTTSAHTQPSSPARINGSFSSATAATSVYRRTSPRSRRHSASTERSNDRVSGHSVHKESSGATTGSADRPSASATVMTGNYSKPAPININSTGDGAGSVFSTNSRSPLSEEYTQTLRSVTAQVPTRSSASAGSSAATPSNMPVRPYSQSNASASVHLSGAARPPSINTNTGSNTSVSNPVSPHSKLRLMTHQTGATAGSGSAFSQKLGGGPHSASPSPSPAPVVLATQRTQDNADDLDFVQVDELDESFTANMSLISIDHVSAAARRTNSTGSDAGGERPQSRKLYLAKEGVNPNPGAVVTATPARVSPVKAVRSTPVSRTSSDTKPKSAGAVRRTPTVNSAPQLVKKKSATTNNSVVAGVLSSDIDRPPSRQGAAFPVNLVESTPTSQTAMPKPYRSNSFDNLLVQPTKANQSQKSSLYQSRDDDPMNQVVLSDDELGLGHDDDDDDDDDNDSEYGDPDMGDGDDDNDVELEAGVGMELQSMDRTGEKSSPVIINEFLCSPRLLHNSYNPKNITMQSNSSSPNQTSGGIMEGALGMAPNTNTVILNSGAGSSAVNNRPPSRQKIAAQHLFHGRKESAGNYDEDYSDYDSTDEAVMDPHRGGSERDRERVLTVGAGGRVRVGSSDVLYTPSGMKPAQSLVTGGPLSKTTSSSPSRVATAPEDYLSNYGSGGDHFNTGYDTVPSAPFKIEVSYSTKSSKVYDTYNSVDNDDFPDDFQMGVTDMDGDDYQSYGRVLRTSPSLGNGIGGVSSSSNSGDWASGGPGKTSNEALSKTRSNGMIATAVPKLSTGSTLSNALNGNTRGNGSLTAPISSGRRGSGVSGLIATPPLTSRNAGNSNNWAKDGVPHSHSRVSSAIGRSRNKKEWVSASSHSQQPSPRIVYDHSSPEDTGLIRSPSDEINDFGDDAMMLTEASIDETALGMGAILNPSGLTGSGSNSGHSNAVGTGMYGMNLSHSMQQQQMLETSLEEDFLSLFAPG